MRQTIEFKVNPDKFKLIPDDIQRSGTVKVLHDGLGRPSVIRLTLEIHSVECTRLIELNRASRDEGGHLYVTAVTKRMYTPTEHANAKLFLLHFTQWIDASAEYSGTTYATGSGCSFCGLDREPIDGLRLPLSKFPKRRQFASTWVPEPLAREDVVHGCLNEGLVGPRWLTVVSSRKRASSQRQAMNWFGIYPANKSLKLSDATRLGGYIDDAPEDTNWKSSMCPAGHWYGLNLLGRPIVVSGSYCGDDIVMTEKSVGARQGLLTPYRLIFVSRRFYEMYAKMKWTGLEFEPAIEDGDGD